MTADSPSAALQDWLFGPRSPLGLGIGLLVLALDQASKAYMLHIYDIGSRGIVRITPFFDLVLVWNTGISYGLFPQESDLGRWGLILFAFAATVALIVWLARVTTPLAAISIGLIIGGAIGNAVDRLLYGAVADFFSLHAFGFRWYVFNVADAAIVAGVAGLLYEALFRGHKKVSNPSKM